MDTESKNSYFIFLPYTEEIKKANKKVKELPADEWLHGRYEGQMLLEEMCEYLMSKLSDAGFESLAPSLDDRFWTNDYDKKYDMIYCLRAIGRNDILLLFAGWEPLGFLKG